MNDLAGLYSYRSDYERAATLYRAALDIDRQALGQDHPQVGMHVQDLAVTLQLQGKLAEAEPLYAESMQMLQQGARRAHPHDARCAANYGRFLHRSGDLARAEQVLSDVLERDRQARGARHAFVGHDLVNLGECCGSTRRATPKRSATSARRSTSTPKRCRPIIRTSLPPCPGLGRASSNRAASRKPNRRCAVRLAIGDEIAAGRQPAARRGEQRAGALSWLAKQR